MSFNHPTPEALLGRSDSKNPATTCRGLTTAGKPCRRSLAAPKSNGSQSRRLEPGVVAVTGNVHGQLTDAVFFCWQHKDQAERIVDSQRAGPQGRSRLVSVNERTSIDSLVERLGVTQIQQDTRTARTRREPLLSVPTHLESDDRCVRVPHRESREGSDAWPLAARSSKHTRSKQRSAGIFSFLSCFGSRRDDDYYEIVRHRRRPNSCLEKQTPDQRPRQWQMQQSTYVPYTVPTPSLPHDNTDAPRRKSVAQPRRALSELPARSANQGSGGSPTQRLLSQIPRHLSPETTAILLTELSKPISPHDDEGYIYIFWLTDPDNAPDSDTASSLLAAPVSRRRGVDALARTYSVSHRSARQKQTIMLKIGRASNVHRRMTEWTQQCGYALSLVRWYPYVSSSAQSSPQREYPPPSPGMHASRPSLAARVLSDQVRKVPHVHRVERLIHLELADKRVKRNCSACGKEHREWFEVEATEQGIKAVDDAVRRWVTWGENHIQ